MFRFLFGKTTWSPKVSNYGGKFLNLSGIISNEVKILKKRKTKQNNKICKAQRLNFTPKIRKLCYSVILTLHYRSDENFTPFTSKIHIKIDTLSCSIPYSNLAHKSIGTAPTLLHCRFFRCPVSIIITDSLLLNAFR